MTPPFFCLTLGSLAHTTVPFSDVVLYLGLYLYLQLNEKRIGGSG